MADRTETSGARDETPKSQKERPMTPPPEREKSEQPRKKRRADRALAEAANAIPPQDGIVAVERDYQWGRVFRLLQQSFKTMSHERVSYEKAVRELREKHQRDAEVLERRVKESEARCGELSVKLETTEREVSILRRQVDDERREKAQAWEELSHSQRALQAETEKVRDCQRQIHMLRGMLSDMPKGDTNVSDDVRSSMVQHQSGPMMYSRGQNQQQSQNQQQQNQQQTAQQQQAGQQQQQPQYLHYSGVPHQHQPHGQMMMGHMPQVMHSHQHQMHHHQHQPQHHQHQHHQQHQHQPHHHHQIFPRQYDAHGHMM